MPGLLEVQDLAVRYERPGGPAALAVDGVDVDVAEGEVVGLAGESGSGKTTVLLAVLGLLPAAARVARGRVLWRGQDLLGRPERERRALRAAEIALVFQDPALALNPFRRVGAQVREVLTAHRPCSRADAAARVERTLAEVGFADPAGVQDAYPHELSGGQRQRVALAQALVCGPALLLADEPTAALDSVTQAEIGTLLSELQRARGLAVLLVSHDLRTMAALATRTLVMYAGRVVEAGRTSQVLGAPAHPYTRGLLAAYPGRLDSGARRPLVPIPGAAPDPGALPAGCAFEPRCRDRLAACGEAPPPARPYDGRLVRCIAHGA